jgi:cytochrome c oxidase assembly protein subunit 11
MNAALHSELELRNRQMMRKLLVIVVGMLGFCAAMVPLYRQICEAIGITQQRAVSSAVNTQVDRSRTVHVELLASSAGLAWTFEPLDRVVDVNPGATTTVRYRVVNTLGRPVTAHAVMNTAPAIANRYIEKTECFCFSNQTLAAGEAREMPVVFRVKSDAPRDLSTISISYTFFEAAGRT